MYSGTGVNELLRDVSTKYIFWEAKSAGEWGWQAYHLNVPIALKSISWNPQDLSWHVQGLLYFYLSHPQEPKIWKLMP